MNDHLPSFADALPTWWIAVLGRTLHWARLRGQWPACGCSTITGRALPAGPMPTSAERWILLL